MQTLLTKIPSDWNKIPKVSTRSEMIAQRKKDNKPDILFDADGVNNAKNFFISNKSDLIGDSKLSPDDLSKGINTQSNLYDQSLWVYDSSENNHSLALAQKQGIVIFNDQFKDVKHSYPVYSNGSKAKAKSKSDLEAQRKEEIRAKGKYFEQRLNKEYVRQETDPHSTNENFSKQKVEIEYRENPKYRTKKEMLLLKKQQLLQDLNTSCNFNHKSQYERVMYREKYSGCSPGRNITPIHEKIRQENMQHFSDTFGKRPMGLHGAELPKFYDNLKEYWNYNPGLKSSYSSAKKLTILKHDKANEGQYSNRNKKITIQKKQENFKKPNEIEPSGVNVEKVYCRNSRWTNYHYKFYQKETIDEVEKVVEKSSTPENTSKAKVIKTPRSLIAQRMQKKGSFSPGKDQFRSTGFTYSSHLA